MNAQNFPKTKATDPFNVRRVMMPKKGRVWVSFDLVNVELRLIANFSKDPLLVKAFLDGQDLHEVTCNKVFGISKSHTDFAHYRKVSKIITYAFCYSFGTYSVRNELEFETGKKWSKREVESLRHSLFDEIYTQWGEYKIGCTEFARTKGYAITFFGRPRNLVPMYQKSNYFGCAADRAACNHPIQGTCADLLRIAMVNVDTLLSDPAYAPWADLRSSVHDELNFDINVGDGWVLAKELIPAIKKTLSWAPASWPVPLDVGIEMGPSWGEMDIYEEV